MSKTVNDDKDQKATPWAAWMASLSGAAQRALQDKESGPLTCAVAPPDDEELAADYSAFRAALTGRARDGLDALVDFADTDKPELNATVGYGVVVCPDGEWPTVTVYKQPEGAAKRIGALDGEDVCVWAFYGVVLPLTQGPQRHLILQDGQTALTVPTYSGAPIRKVNVDLIADCEPQSDGYLGPDELIKAPVSAMPAKVTAPEDDEVPPEDD